MSTDTQDSAPVGVKPVAVPDAILLMARRIAADNFEHCTSDPIFTVEKRNLIAGLDLDYTDNIGWFCEGEQVDDEDAAALEAAYQESGNVPDNYTRTGIEETWEHFATYVTLEAAREFVDKKGDRYRVYVDSGCRNHEWKALRAFLLQIAANPILAAPVAAQSDVTQQTLDDVMAGIPARDAEIEALRKENEQLRQAINRPVSAETTQPWAPEKCPITQRPFFMWIEHHKTGEMVPTYGGPYDSYTLAEYDGESFICERFDHDAGGWLVDCVEGLGVKLVDDQALVIDPNNTRYDEIEAFAAAPVAAQAQPEPSKPSQRFAQGGYAAQSLPPLKGINEGLSDATIEILAKQYDCHTAPGFKGFAKAVEAQAQQPVSGADGLPPMPEGNCATEVGGSSHNPPIYFESDMIEYAHAALAQQDADIEAAAKTLAECMDYPWEPMPEQGRDAMRKHAKDIIDAARKEPDQ